MTAPDRRRRPAPLARERRHLGDFVLRVLVADDMTRAHDAWSPDEAGDSYEYGGFRLYGTTRAAGKRQYVHLYRAEDLHPVLSRDPSEYQLLIWLAETFTRAEAEELVPWVRDRHPELGQLVWYDVDAERWPSSPLPASRVDRGCQLLDFLRDPTFPLETRVMAVVMEGAEAAALNGRIVPKLRQAPPHNCDALVSIQGSRMDSMADCTG